MTSHQNTPQITLPAEDLEAITATTLDYYEGSYSADVDRMRRCLHPDFIKRTVVRDPNQADKWQLGPTSTAEMMITYTKEGGGSSVHEEQQMIEVKILAGFRHIASVQVGSHEYLDYLLIAKFDDQRWLIVDALWEMQEGEYVPDAKHIALSQASLRKV